MAEVSTSCTKAACHEDGVWACAWASDDVLLTGSADETVKMWDASSGDANEMGKLVGHELAVVGVAAHPASSRAVSSSLDSCLRVWDVSNMTCDHTIDCGPVESWSVAISPDGKQVATGAQSGNINVFDTDTEEKTVLESTSNCMAMSTAYSNDGRLLACGDMDGAVNVFDVKSMSHLLKLDGHKMGVRGLAFTPDSSTLMTASDDMSIKLFDMRDGARQGNTLINAVGSCSGHSSWVLAIAACPSGPTFATGSSDHTVKIWDMSKRECVQTFTNHADQVWSVSYNESGSKLASVSDDRSLAVYTVT